MSEAMEKIREILNRMIKDELLGPRAAKVIAELNESTTPEDLGMDSLARFALYGELRRVFGAKIDPRAISAAKCVGEVLREIKSKEA